MLPGLFCPQCHHLPGHGVCVILVTAILGGFVQRDGLQLLVPHPVVAQRLHQLAHRANGMVKNQVFHRQQRIHGGGEGDPFNSDKAKFRAAFVDIFTTFRAALYQARNVRRLEILGANLFRALVCFNTFTDDIARLEGVGFPELLPGGEAGRIAAVFTITTRLFCFSAERVDHRVQVVTPGEREFHRFEQVQVIVNGTGAVIPDHGVLQAANWGVLMHVFRMDEVLHPGFACFQHHAGHRALVEVQQEGCPLAGGDHIYHLGQQVIGRAAMQAHVGFRLQDGRHLVNDFEHGEGEVIGHVRAALTRPAQGEQLPVPGSDALVTAGLDHSVVGGIAMHPKAFEDFLAEFALHPFSQGTLPERVEILVNTPKGNTRARVAFIGHNQHVCHPQGLHRLPEGFCGFPGHTGKIVRHLL